jgi:hypothetical protein
LQLARVLPRLFELLHATRAGEPRRRRRVAEAIADAILDGAHSRSARRFVATIVDVQARTTPLTRPRPSRPGRSPQTVAARRRRCKR